MGKFKDAENYRLSIDFPALEKYPLIRTSRATRNYNCFGFVVEDYRRPWSCLPILPRGHYWPPNIRRVEDDAGSVLAAYSFFGYEPCADGALEVGIEKIAIYVTEHDVPTHAAIQRESGLWQSKLGSDIDAEHSLESLESSAEFGPSLYGRAKYFLKRPRIRPFNPADLPR